MTEFSYNFSCNSTSNWGPSSAVEIESFPLKKNQNSIEENSTSALYDIEDQGSPNFTHTSDQGSLYSDFESASSNSLQKEKKPKSRITNFYGTPCMLTEDTSPETIAWRRITPISVEIICPQRRKKRLIPTDQIVLEKNKKRRYPASQNYKGQISRAYSRYLIKKLKSDELDVNNFQKIHGIPLHGEFKQELIIYIRGQFHGKKIGKSSNGLRQETSKVNNFNELQKVFHLDFEDQEIRRGIKLFLKNQLVEFFKPENFHNWLNDSEDCQISPDNKAFYKKNRFEMMRNFMGDVNKCKFENPTEEELREFNEDPTQMVSY